MNCIVNCKKVLEPDNGIEFKRGAIHKPAAGAIGGAAKAKEECAADAGKECCTPHDVTKRNVDKTRRVYII